MELSGRLQRIADYVVPGKGIVDVGTDHAHLPIYLVQHGIVPHALACDVRRGPLKHAEENIAASGCKEQIETRLSDGLKEVDPGEAETLIIAGMGGILISRILEEGNSTASSMDIWILEPQSDVDLVRKRIYQMGYHIEDETLICEEGKYYPIMFCVQGEQEEPGELELKFGPVLLRKKEALLKTALVREEKTLLSILKELSAGESEKARSQMLKKQRELENVREALRYYEMQ